MGALDPKNRRNLGLRVASALVLFPLAVWITILGGLPFALLAAAAGAVAGSELILMFSALGAAEVLGIAGSAAIPLVAAFGESGDLLPGWSGLALAAATVLLLALALARRGPLEAMAWLYCGVLLAAVVGLRLRFGVGWVILSFVVTWANDTFAYFAGHAFGRHRMAERISPKKTWEGFAGGAVGSVAGALVTRWLFPDLGADLSAPMAVLLGAGGAVLGPLGDLSESALKRAAGVKDSGKIIPGHGGLLDRIDALLFVSPWVYVFANVLVTR
jgi:phosphatidate cytidylyltransferase